MSIASEIQDLQSNLANAKTAVTVKGGTVADTGLAGLASEIASIPTGGSISSYGTVKYYDENNVLQTVEMVTEADYLELTIGTQLSTLHINGTSIVKEKINEVVINDGVQYIPDKFCYYCNGLQKTTIPSSVHFIGQNVYYSCNLIQVNFSLDNVLFIGHNFLQGNSNFNTPIVLPKVLQIADGFLANCVSFNSAITLNDNIETIGNSFLATCTSYSQPFTIPSGLIDDQANTAPIGGQFFYNCYNFTGPLVCNISPTNLGYGSTTSYKNQILGTSNATAAMYTTGVTLTGTYALDWKNALPDRTSSPFRKLIVGS